MNTRERFVRTLTGEKVDRVPFIKIFGGTNAVHPHWEEEYPGIGECIDELLGFEGTYRGWGITKVNMDPANMSETEVLEETESISVHRMGDGTVVLYIRKELRRQGRRCQAEGARGQPAVKS
ncbi:hypothetical protein ACFLQR_02495 [Verrucomicrobiota bacterium]